MRDIKFNHGPKKLQPRKIYASFFLPCLPAR